jgi:hypothetical protein
MRLIRPFFLCAAVTLLGARTGQTQAAPPPPPAPAPAKPPVKKPPSRLKAITTKLADTAATSVAGMAVDSLLGTKGKSMVNALGVGANPCAALPAGVAAALPAGVLPTGALANLAGASAGASMVNAAKKALKKKGDTTTAPPATAAAPCPTAAAQAAVAAGATGAAAAAAAAGVGANGMPGGMSPMGMVAMASPIGMAAAAAPMAGQAVKGLKGMFGGKRQDKIAMLRDLGKGRLELKDVKFIEGTAEMEPGFEPALAELGEAIALAEGTYILHVPAEAGDKGEAPDTVLARKRIEKVWAAILVNGVPDQRIIAVGVLSPEMNEGRKPPKKGEARVEFIRLPKQP